MRAVDIINKKKYGNELSPNEIEFMVSGYTRGEIPDYQMAAFCMAVYFQGMVKEEIAVLTDTMVKSGEQVDLSEISGIKVDKHSTGGVGDKISLIVIPLVASVGIPVAKMSGRGLGHTGGTIDKLESIEGFKVELSPEKFIDNVNRYKMAIVGQSGNLTPADKKMYALRDVTGTIDSIPLIASSIMSKKIASGADAIVLDVKVGAGAFMKSLEDARELAKTMVEIGSALGRKTVAVLTNMAQPLGHEVGNANEVKEAIAVLSGHGDADERHVALTIAAHMCVLGDAFETFDAAYSHLAKVIDSGKALSMLKTFIKIQGGNGEIVDDPTLLPSSKYSHEVTSDTAGYITALDAERVGLSAMLLGAGRKTKEDPIDYAAGITLKKKIGDYVEKGDVLCLLHCQMPKIAEASEEMLKAYTIQEHAPESLDYVLDVITAESL